MSLRKALVIGGLALEGLIAPVAGLLVGSKADEHFSTGPYLSIVFFLLGVAVMVRLAMRLYRIQMNELNK